jgi:ABC-2 type transport system ATP-binding protein
VNKLSRGMKQRLSLARCLLHDPQLLILDEPASGLDPQARADLKYILRALRETGKSVLISSHILPELGEFCDKVIILKQGVKLAEGSIDEISNQLGEKAKISYTLLKEDDFEAAAAIARMFPQTGNIFKNNMTLEIEFSGTDEETAELTRRLVVSGILIVSINRTQKTLEEVFLEVIDDENKNI